MIEAAPERALGGHQQARLEQDRGLLADSVRAVALAGPCGNGVSERHLRGSDPRSGGSGPRRCATSGARFCRPSPTCSTVWGSRPRSCAPRGPRPTNTTALDRLTEVAARRTAQLLDQTSTDSRTTQWGTASPRRAPAASPSTRTMPRTASWPAWGPTWPLTPGRRVPQHHAGGEPHLHLGPAEPARLHDRGRDDDQYAYDGMGRRLQASAGPERPTTRGTRTRLYLSWSGSPTASGRHPPIHLRHRPRVDDRRDGQIPLPARRLRKRYRPHGREQQRGGILRQRPLRGRARFADNWGPRDPHALRGEYLDAETGLYRVRASVRPWTREVPVNRFPCAGLLVGLES